MARVAAHPTHILIIDDDPILRELLCALLAAEGYTAESAESGPQALMLLRSGFAADVILADIQLPGLAGSALAAELRTLSPNACLLAMSGSEAPPEARSAFDGFLLKPLSIEDFASAISAASSEQRKAEKLQPVSPAEHTHPEPLDEATYNRLTKSLPSAQLAELYQLSLADIASRIDLLRDSLVAHDGDAYRREAHALKGGCGMVGALELARLAARAEAGSSGDTPAMEEFAAAAARLRSIIAARFTVPNEPQ